MSKFTLYGLEERLRNWNALRKIIGSAKPIYRNLICGRRLFTNQLVKDIFQSVKITIVKSLIHERENITIRIEILVNHLSPSCPAD